MIEVAEDGQTIKAFRKKPLEPDRAPRRPGSGTERRWEITCSTREVLMEVVSDDAKDESSSHDIGRGHHPAARLAKAW